MQQPVIVKARMRTMKKNDFPAPATFGAFSAFSASPVPLKIVRGITLSERVVGGAFWHLVPV